MNAVESITKGVPVVHTAPLEIPAVCRVCGQAYTYTIPPAITYRDAQVQAFVHSGKLGPGLCSSKECQRKAKET